MNTLRPLIYAILISTPSLTQALELSAPFGFDWGMTRSHIQSKGISLECEPTEGTFTICSTDNALKPISIAESYVLVFSDRYGLNKISMIGKNIDNDIIGSSGKAMYSKFKTTLSEKYGPPSTSYENTGRKLYDGYDEFYQCLRYTGCGNWISFWSDGIDGAISLEIIGLRRGVGYIRLVYESKLWRPAVEEHNKKINTKDSEAL